MVGLIPTRYPDAHTSEDEQIRLARKTEWREVGEGAYLGTGQRMLATDQGEYSMLELRRIELQS
jgi:type VI secretion system protein ImpE